jgi:hypothetical protein
LSLSSAARSASAGGSACVTYRAWKFRRARPWHPASEYRSRNGIAFIDIRFQEMIGRGGWFPTRSTLRRLMLMHLSGQTDITACGGHKNRELIGAAKIAVQSMTRNRPAMARRS